MMKSLRLLSRRLRVTSVPRTSFSSSIRTAERRSIQQTYIASTRAFTTTRYVFKGLQPDSSDPKPPATEPHVQVDGSLEAADISESQYHEIADQYLNVLILALEELAEDAKRGIEVEYSAGVLTVSHPSGSYVVNKQPPNKQIWLSSPTSGPKRFDWVANLSTQQEKQDTEGHEGAVGDDGQMGGGKWVYLRDGTSLTDLLEREVGVVLAHEGEGDITAERAGPGSGGSVKLEGE